MPADPTQATIEPPRGSIEYHWGRVQGSAYGAEVHLGHLVDWTRTVKRGSGVSQHAFHLVARRIISHAYVKRGYVTEWKTVHELVGGYSTRHGRRILRAIEEAGIASPITRSGRPGKLKVFPGVIYSLAVTGEKTAVAAEEARERSHLRSPASEPSTTRPTPDGLPSWAPMVPPGSTATRAELYAAIVEITRAIGGEAVANLPDIELGGQRKRIYTIWADRNFCPLPKFVEEVRLVVAAYQGGAGGQPWGRLRAAGKLPGCLLTRAYWLENVRIANDWASRQNGRQAADVARAAARDGLDMPDAIELEGPAVADTDDTDLWWEQVHRRYQGDTEIDLAWMAAQPRRVEDGRHVLGVDVESWPWVVEALDGLRALAQRFGAVRLEPER